MFVLTLVITVEEEVITVRNNLAAHPEVNNIFIEITVFEISTVITENDCYRPLLRANVWPYEADLISDKQLSSTLVLLGET